MADPVQDPQSPPPPTEPPAEPGKNDKEQRGDAGGLRKMPRPPVQTFIFWLVVLFALPLTLFFFNNSRGQQQTDELIASDFEKLLLNRQVLELTVVKDPGTAIRTITGQYRPEKGAEAGGNVPEPRKFKVDVVYTDTLDQMIRDYAPRRRAETTSNLWSNILISVLPILLLVGIIYFLFSRQLKAAGKGALQFGKSRARLFAPTHEKVTFADVSGIEEAKEEVQEIIDFLRSPQKFQKLGGRIPKGVLMVGPPGSGKTLLARAIAGEAEVPFFSISGSDFVEMFVGVGASRVRDMFEEGKRHAPCIIFIDEIDAVGRSRFSGIGGGHDEREQTLNALLVEMDGFEYNAGIIVIAATNRPDVLDTALLRPGRFDRQITIDLPDVTGRIGILKVHSKKVTLSPDADLEIVARGTPGFSGADLANLINEAALIAARLNKKHVEMADLEEARDKVRWGKERRSRKIDEHDRQVTAFHEAGHALASMLCSHTTPLHKVTIVPRGTAYLGATMHLPERDRYTQGRKELLDELVVLMGGRIAEELVFDDITSGAAMDIRQASDLAKKMVCQWGMSDKLGPLSFSGREEPIFLGRDLSRSENYSEETAREIDGEIRRLISTAERSCRELLRQNLEKLKLLGSTLIERETMSAADIRLLLGLPRRDAADASATGAAEPVAQPAGPTVATPSPEPAAPATAGQSAPPPG